MRKTKRLVALALISQLMVWTHLSAQETGLDALPEGFPVDDVTYMGNNEFSSEFFGNFRLDTSVPRKVIHEKFGPFIWEWDNETKIVTLVSEWWGPVYTTLPEDSSPLGFNFPYIKSEMTGKIYWVEVPGDRPTPFYMHEYGGDGNWVGAGWVRSIGIELHNTQAYYLHAEAQFVNMQNHYGNMVVGIQQLAQMDPQPRTQALETQRALVLGVFNELHEDYKRYQFYYHRAQRAPVFVEQRGGNTEQATWWKNASDALHSRVEQLFQQANTLLSRELEPTYANRVNDRTAAEAALQAAEEAERQRQQQRPPSSGGSTPPPSSGGTATPRDPINVEGDVIAWKDVRFSGSRFSSAEVLAAEVPTWRVSSNIRNFRITPYSPGVDTWAHYEQHGAENWPQVAGRATSGGQKVNGNWWIFVPYDGLWYAVPYEGFVGVRRYGPAAMGNLNLIGKTQKSTDSHRSIMINTMLDYRNTHVWGTPHGTPKSGVKYGFMASTEAGVYARAGNFGRERSNIFWAVWP